MVAKKTNEYVLLERTLRSQNGMGVEYLARALLRKGIREERT